MVVLAGVAAAWHYAMLGLTLSHHDARAHLVVARRIFDNLMPGWQQIGGIWLPLPHVLNALPVQVDAWYRTGASGVALSIISIGVAAWALSAFLIRLTGSVTAAVAGAALLLANPNTLYLQSTPMTEPVLFGTTMLAIALSAEWLDRGSPLPPRAPGVALIAAVMTRYEAWPVAAALVGGCGLVLARRGVPIRRTATACLRLAAYPAAAIVLFAANSRWTTGDWFVNVNFYVPENAAALDQPRVAWQQVLDGLYQLSGTATVWPAWTAALVIIIAFVRSRALAPAILVLALLSAAVLPWSAYLNGHPLRIRYSLPLVVACSAITATGLALLPRRIQAIGAVVLLLATVWQVSPLDRAAPLIAESQRDAANAEGRTAVTTYLRSHYDGGTIMMSMGSLAHYMHDLSRTGFAIHDFMHEGNHDLWQGAVAFGPHGFVEWVAIEEKAEGGDLLFQRLQQQPDFLRGFERVAEGGGVALYRAVPPPSRSRIVPRR